MAAPRERRTFAWSLRLLLWHVVLAHACLLLALGWIALRPACLLASAVHPEVLACVHLVTLGYLTTSCVGAFHVVLPLAMGTSLRATFVDWFLLVALQLTATGVAAQGMNGFVYTIDQANNRATTGVPTGWTAATNCWTLKKDGSC